MGDTSTDQLIRRAAAGSRTATDALLEKHRERLRRMVALQMDDRIKGRVDASDVVQETMIEASRRLPEYLADQPIPFYPWLRRIAAQRLEKLYRRHVVAQKRSVTREVSRRAPLNNRSSMLLSRHLIASETSPSGNLSREERRQRVQTALQSLSAGDQEVLVLRHLEQLSIAEVAAVLQVTETAAKSRHFRAIHHLQTLLGHEFSEG